MSESWKWTNLFSGWERRRRVCRDFEWDEYQPLTSTVYACSRLCDPGTLISQSQAGTPQSLEYYNVAACHNKRRFPKFQELDWRFREYRYRCTQLQHTMAVYGGAARLDSLFPYDQRMQMYDNYYRSVGPEIFVTRHPAAPQILFLPGMKPSRSFVRRITWRQIPAPPELITVDETETNPHLILGINYKASYSTPISASPVPASGKDQAQRNPRTMKAPQKRVRKRTQKKTEENISAPESNSEPPKKDSARRARPPSQPKPRAPRKTQSRTNKTVQQKGAAPIAAEEPSAPVDSPSLPVAGHAPNETVPE